MWLLTHAKLILVNKRGPWASIPELKKSQSHDIWIQNCLITLQFDWYAFIKCHRNVVATYLTNYWMEAQSHSILTCNMFIDCHAAFCVFKLPTFLRRYQNKSILLFLCEMWKISVNERMGSIYPVELSCLVWETDVLWCNIEYDGYLATQRCLLTNRCYIWFLDCVGISMVILWLAITILFRICNQLNTCLA